MTKERVCANDTALSRRSILAAVPAVALSSPALAREEDPILPHYREWLSARRDWRRLADLPGNEDWDDPRSIAAQNRENKAERAMLSITPTTKEGIAALAALAWSYVDPGIVDPEEYEQRLDDGKCQAVAAIWRACTGQKSSFPQD